MLGFDVVLLDCRLDRGLGIGGLDLPEVDRLLRDAADLPDGGCLWFRGSTATTQLLLRRHKAEFGGVWPGVKAVRSRNQHAGCALPWWVLASPNPVPKLGPESRRRGPFGGFRF